MAKKPAPKKASKPVKKTAKPAPKKAAAKKPAKAKPVAKKPAAKKPAPKKPVVKKPVPKKAAAKPVKKSVATKAAAPKKSVVKKAAPKKPVAKKAVVVAKPMKAAPAKPAPKPAPVKQAAPPKPAPAPKKVPAPAPKAVTPKPAVTKESKKAAAKEPKAPSKPLVTQRVAPSRPMAAPVVKKQVSTLEKSDRIRYSDEELNEFKELILKKLEEARRDYDLLKQTLANTDNNGTDDTSPSFKMIEDGSETLSREETAQLAARQEKFIKHLEDALLRIRNKTYGICRVTGRLISKERLRLVPHATLSIEAKQQMSN